MKIRWILLAAFLLQIVPASAFAQSNASGQDVTVTFYSHGSFLHSALPTSKEVVFYGNIYDGPQLLFGFKDGFVGKSNRFIVLRLSPGTHTFSASLSKHPANNCQFTFNFEGGKTYFLRVVSESARVIGLDKGRLDEVTCQVAHEEMQKSSVLKNNAISPDIIARWDAAQVIPPCL